MCRRTRRDPPRRRHCPAGLGARPVKPPIALTIAGVDSSGGAGVVADLGASASMGVGGTCVITAVTAQNSLGVDAIETISPEVVVAQIKAVCGDMHVGAIKTGMV